MTDTPFPTDGDAKQGGIPPGHGFPVSPDNCWGVPSHFMKILEPPKVWYDDNQAVIDLGYDVAFPMAKENPYGIPGCEGLLKIVPLEEPFYNSDLEAQAAGVQTGEIYITNGINYGFTGYFLKQQEL